MTTLQPKSTQRSLWVMVLGVFWCACIGLAVFLIGRVYPDVPLWPFAALFLVGLFIIALGVKGVMSRWVVRRLEVATEYDVLHLGEVFHYQVTLETRRKVFLNSVRCTLRCQERALWRDGFETIVFSGMLYEMVETHQVDARCESGKASVVSGVFETPEDGMCTFEGRVNSVHWLLEVYLDIKNWPDFEEVYQVRVVPVVGRLPEVQVVPRESSERSSGKGGRFGTSPPFSPPEGEDELEAKPDSQPEAEKEEVTTSD